MTLQVIKYETQRERGVLGCSVFGYSDAYLRLQPLLRRFQQLRRSCKDPKQAPQLYLISADVSQAYDSIHVSKLMSLVEPLLKSPHYLIMKHVEVSTIRLHCDLLSVGQAVLLQPCRTLGNCKCCMAFFNTGAFFDTGTETPPAAVKHPG